MTAPPELRRAASSRLADWHEAREMFLNEVV